MAIAHDAVSRNTGDTDATTHTGNWSWTHTPVGTPRGVVVAIVQSGSGATDDVSAVTYGGVGLTRVRRDQRTVTEQGATYLYHLGSGVPTGAQTVAITSGAVVKQAYCYTMTAAAGMDTAVDAANGADLGIIANPSVTVTHTGTLSGWAGYAIHAYGAAAPVSTGLQTGETFRFGVDFGAFSGMTYSRHGGADAASSTYGYTTLASDDQLITALVVTEVAEVLPEPVGQVRSRLWYPGMVPGSLARFTPSRRSAQIPETSHSVTEFAVTFSVWEARELPQYLRPGSLLIGFLASDRNTFTTVTDVPAGWREIPGAVPTQNQLGTADLMGWFYSKILQEGDPELAGVLPAWTLASTSAGVLVLVRYEGAHPLSPVNTARSIGTPSGTSHVLPTIEPSVDGCRIIAGVAADKTSSTSPFNYWTPPAGWVERLDIEGAGSFEEVAVADIMQATAAPISATFTSFDSEGAVGFIVALNPASAVIATDPRSQVGPLLHPGPGPSRAARFFQRPAATEISEITPPVVGATSGEQRTSGTAATGKGGLGATQGPQRTSGQAAGAKQAAGAAVGAVRVGGQTSGIKGGQGATAGPQRATAAAAGVKQATAAVAGEQRSSGTAVKGIPPSGAAVGTLRISGATTGVKGASGAAVGQARTSGVPGGTHQALGAAMGQQRSAAAAAGTKATSGAAVGQQRTDGLVTVLPPVAPIVWAHGTAVTEPAATGAVTFGGDTGEARVAAAATGEARQQ